MDWKLFLPVVAICFLNVTCAYSFSLRKRPSSNEPSDLSGALKVLKRQKRRVSIDDYVRNNLDAYDPYENFGALGRRYTLEDFLNAYPQYVEALENEGEPETKNTPFIPELKGLFESKGKDDKKNSMIDEAIKIKSDGNKDKNKITKAQMQQLLNQVKMEEEAETKLTGEQLNSDSTQGNEEGDSDSPEGTTKPEPVTKEELNDIFNNEDTETGESTSNSDTAESNNDNEEADSSPGGEMVPQTNSFPVGNQKKVTKRDNGDSLTSSLVQEIADLRDENARLQLLEALEDQENDFLASALKEATLSQMDGDDTYLRPEYKDIENAIRNEEILQELKSNPSVAMDIATLEQLANDRYVDQLEDEEEEDEEDDDLIPDKRGGVSDDGKPTYEDGLGRWYESPVPEDLEGEGTADNKAEAEEVLEEFVRQYLQNDQEDDDDVDSNQDIQRRSDMTDKDEDEIREALTKYLSAQEQAQPMEYDIEEESCPPVDLINPNCAIADKMRLPIDEEARNLCNRHEMCYFCGGSLDMSPMHCDKGFRSEVISMCGPNKNCIRDGAQFLWLIKSGHLYNSEVVKECADTCVRDYIFGL